MFQHVRMNCHVKTSVCIFEPLHVLPVGIVRILSAMARRDPQAAAFQRTVESRSMLEQSDVARDVRFPGAHLQKKLPLARVQAERINEAFVEVVHVEKHGAGRHTRRSRRIGTHIKDRLGSTATRQGRFSRAFALEMSPVECCVAAVRFHPSTGGGIDKVSRPCQHDIRGSIAKAAEKLGRPVSHHFSLSDRP
ncbi:hypothetical protein [Jannaschia seosinensis]|uniref:hypothetical protein n=1 Tax=Jannaschia seosinensis TaxID=313367 RepID=UPI0006E28D04|nr:hypothetical protein [Jannaschia seosinensis]